MSTTDASTPVRPPPARRKGAALSFLRKLAAAGGLHVLLTLLALTLVLPFAWMVLTSLTPLEEVGGDSWIPSKFLLKNYKDVFGARGIMFGRWYWNSVFVATAVTFFQVLTSSLAAFSFSRLRWKGRDKVFLLYLGTMMLPGLVMMIPNYQIMTRLGLVDTYAGLIVTASFSAFGTFLLRQFMMTIPSSLDEAAEIDGASKWAVFWEVILPLSRPGLIALTIFTFIGNLRSFFWPLVMMKSAHRYTLPIGFLFFDSSYGMQIGLLMAAVTMFVVPMAVVFIFLQKQLVRGIQLGAVKG